MFIVEIKYLFMSEINYTEMHPVDHFAGLLGMIMTTIFFFINHVTLSEVSGMCTIIAALSTSVYYIKSTFWPNKNKKT